MSVDILPERKIKIKEEFYPFQAMKPFDHKAVSEYLTQAYRDNVSEIDLVTLPITLRNIPGLIQARAVLGPEEWEEEEYDEDVNDYCFGPGDFHKRYTSQGIVIRSAPITFSVTFLIRSMRQFIVLSDYYFELKGRKRNYLYRCQGEDCAQTTRDNLNSLRQGQALSLTDKDPVDENGDAALLVLPMDDVILSRIPVMFGRYDNREDDEDDVVVDPHSPRTLVPMS